MPEGQDMMLSSSAFDGLHNHKKVGELYAFQAVQQILGVCILCCWVRMHLHTDALICPVSWSGGLTWCKLVSCKSEVAFLSILLCP